MMLMIFSKVLYPIFESFFLFPFSSLLINDDYDCYDYSIFFCDFFFILLHCLILRRFLFRDSFPRDICNWTGPETVLNYRFRSFLISIVMWHHAFFCDWSSDYSDSFFRRSSVIFLRFLLSSRWFANILKQKIMTAESLDYWHCHKSLFTLQPTTKL